MTNQVTTKKRLAWIEMRRTMTKKMAAMKRQSFLSDVTLVSAEGKEFAAHKVHLCAASDYFFRLFNSGMSESQKGRVVLDQISPFAMSVVLDFIYTGDIPDMAEGDINQLGELLLASDYLCINALSDYFGEHACEKLNIEHFREQWEMAELFQNKRLLHGIPKLIAINFRLVSNDPKFLELSGEQLKVVLQHPDLHVDPPDPIVEAILRWIQSDLENRRHFFEALVSLVDITHLTHNYIDAIRNQDLIQQSEGLVNKLNDAKNIQWATCSKLVMVSREANQQSVKEFKVRIYDLKNECVSLKTDMPKKYNADSIALYKDHLYFSSTSGVRKDDAIFKYNPVTSKLSLVGILNPPFLVIEAAILDGMMYLFGRERRVGPLTEQIRDLQRISLSTGECEVLARTKERYAYKALSLDDHVYVVSSDDCSRTVTVEGYSVLFDQWTEVGSYVHGIDATDIYGFGYFYGHFTAFVDIDQHSSLSVYDATNRLLRVTNFTTDNVIMEICAVEVGGRKKIYFVDSALVFYVYNLDDDRALPQRHMKIDEEIIEDGMLFAVTEKIRIMKRRSSSGLE